MELSKSKKIISNALCDNNRLIIRVAYIECNVYSSGIWKHDWNLFAISANFGLSKMFFDLWFKRRKTKKHLVFLFFR